MANSVEKPFAEVGVVAFDVDDAVEFPAFWRCWRLRSGRLLPSSCSLRRQRWRAGHEFRQFSQILDGGGQRKFVMRAGVAAQSQTIQLQDARLP